MKELLSALPNTFIPLFIAVDVAWLLPIFMAFTADMESRERKVLLRESLEGVEADDLPVAVERLEDPAQGGEEPQATD